MQPAALLIAHVLPIHIADVEHVRLLAEIRGVAILRRIMTGHVFGTMIHVSFSYMVNTLDQSERVPKLVSGHV